MTNDANDFVGIIHFFDEFLNHIISADLIGCPAAWENDRKKFIGLQVFDFCIRGDDQTILAAYRFEIKPGTQNLCAFFL